MTVMLKLYSSLCVLSAAVVNAQPKIICEGGSTTLQNWIRVHHLNTDPVIAGVLILKVFVYTKVQFISAHVVLFHI